MASLFQYLYNLTRRMDETMPQAIPVKRSEFHPAAWRQSHMAFVNPFMTEKQRSALKKSQQNAVRRKLA